MRMGCLPRINLHKIASTLTLSGVLIFTTGSKADLPSGRLSMSTSCPLMPVLSGGLSVDSVSPLLDLAPPLASGAGWPSRNFSWNIPVIKLTRLKLFQDS